MDDNICNSTRGTTGDYTSDIKTDNYDNIDYISLDRNIIFQCHGKYIYLFGNENLTLFKTKRVIDLAENPITQKKFSPHIINYIKFRAECYNDTRDMLLTKEILEKTFSWYENERRAGITVDQLKTSPETEQNYKIVRYYMTAIDFQSHFKQFDPADSDQERYERDLAEKALRNGGRKGLWLLRHSSYNRPGKKETIDRLRRYGIRYYALSFVDEEMEINHLLLTHQVGVGWNYLRAWFPTFIDCLEYTLDANNISYFKRISSYINWD